MRFWLSGPRILGIRPGVSFGPHDWHMRGLEGRMRTSVYVIEGGHGLVKIGISTNVQARLATLQTSSPFPLRLVFEAGCDDAMMAEQEAHAALARYRMAGEWFDVPAHMAIAAVAEAAGRIIEHDSDSEPAIWKSLFWRSLWATVPFWLMGMKSQPQAAMFFLALGLTLVAASMWRRLLALPQGPMIALKIMGVVLASCILAIPLAGIASGIISVLPIPWRPS